MNICSFLFISVVKEPPYSVKESGYAGFNFPIEVYLKNRDEPKKIKFNYDLHLQNAGPAIKKVRNEPYVFPNPSDDFRRKLLKGGGTPVSGSNSLHSNPEHERNSRDSFTDEKPQQLIGKPKLGGDNAKKHKTKEYRIDDVPRPSNSFENLFGATIHKTSRNSPDPKKPSPTSKSDKKEKSYSDKEKQKSKIDGKEKDYREEKKILKEDKNKEEKRKLHKEKDISKDKGIKRSADKPTSPSPPPKKPVIHPHSPKRVSSPSNKSNSSASSKEETKPVKQNIPDIKTKPQKPPEISSSKIEKKMKKEKKSHDKDRDSVKKEHKKDKETKSSINDNRDIKSKELSKETVLKDTPSKDKEKPPTKPDKLINKFSIENMLKDPQDAVKYENSKHKVKSDRERKHKHKKKDKKRDESREKNRDSVPKEKKHKGEKKSSDIKEISIPEKNESITISKDLDKSSSSSKSFKEKDRNQLTISPISHDTSSQSSTKSTNKNSKITKNPLDSMIAELGSSSDSESDNSIASDDEDMDSHKNVKINKPVNPEPVRSEPPKLQISDSIKTDKPPVERNDKNNQFSNSRMQKTKEKPTKQELKEEKKERKRKTSSKGDDESKMSKSMDDMEPSPKKRSDNSNSSLLDGSQRVKPESSRSKTDTKVQDDGVSSSLSDNPIKCDSPSIEDSYMAEPHEISPDYMIQLQELQQRIMTLQSNEELERVVNLIAETGKYEVTKKTFDFDLCMLDRSTVQQLQKLIGCESRA